MVADNNLDNETNNQKLPNQFVVVVDKNHNKKRVYDLDEMEAFLYPMNVKELSVVFWDSLRLAYNVGRTAGSKRRYYNEERDN